MGIAPNESLSEGPGSEPRTLTALLLESIALRHQIAVLERSRTRRPCFRLWDRLFWILFSRWWPQWRDSLMKSESRTESKGTILVVDDERAMTSMLAEVLEAEGYSTLTANSGDEALALIRRGAPELVISDLRMSGMNGHQLQSEIKRLSPDFPIVIITGFGSIETAVESMKRGAFDFITKPFTNNQLTVVVNRALEDRQLRQEVRRLRGELARTYGVENIIATNPKMTELLEIVLRIADSPASVLLTGESGTGKDLIARALHFQSHRAAAPFVPINKRSVAIAIGPLVGLRQ
jgi:DNA-binding NtrC family response regulator